VTDGHLAINFTDTRRRRRPCGRWARVWRRSGLRRRLRPRARPVTGGRWSLGNIPCAGHRTRRRPESRRNV